MVVGVHRVKSPAMDSTKTYSHCWFFRDVPQVCTTIILCTHLSSECVRDGASQKKPLWDSSKTYSPKGFTFRDVPYMTHYHG